ncbi:hypothetical protein EPR50_G00028630 [Perca flavescens]|uniref:Uncharacterized protein n=1 Tax=Perca flavescens TaxID=8167 RepID=A0A484DIT1_PERFV|nr:hypothetical protein EPR50_G00028630 [Perca flavescens]
MGEWTILERLLEAAVQQHSTMIGRIRILPCSQSLILLSDMVGGGGDQEGHYEPTQRRWTSDDPEQCQDISQ